MSAGDLITKDWQFEIRTTLFGCRQGGFSMSPELPQGLGNPEPVSSDTTLYGQPGSVGAPEYDGLRAITFEVVTVADTAAAALNAIAAVNTAWASSPVDIALVMRLPGASFGKFKVMGRPRGTRPTGRTISGKLTTMLRFDALSPTITYL